jgi:hypothetical protein
MYAVPRGNSVVVTVYLENLIPTCSNRCSHGRGVCVGASLGQKGHSSRVVDDRPLIMC